jgi:uncharacterized protein (TIGR02145 family)
MEKVSLILSAALISAMVLTSFINSGSKEEASKEVTIGKQVWMSENLYVDKFRNGDPIPEAQSNDEWRLAGDNEQPAWCYYDKDPTNGTKYGKLYNWYAVNDPRGLAPEGYHIPTIAEWTKLIDFLGGRELAGGKMKSTDTHYWESPNISADNSCGFSGLPGGSRYYSGGFEGVGYWGEWWSSTGYKSIFNEDHAWHLTLYNKFGDCNRAASAKFLGYSVRCLRD